MTSRDPVGDRRDFLKLAVLGTTAGAAVAVSGEAEASTAAEDGGRGAADYRETDHVKTFYRLARF